VAVLPDLLTTMKFLVPLWIITMHDFDTYSQLVEVIFHVAVNVENYSHMAATDPL